MHQENHVLKKQQKLNFSDYQLIQEYAEILEGWEVIKLSISLRQIQDELYRRGLITLSFDDTKIKHLYPELFI